MTKVPWNLVNPEAPLTDRLGVMTRTWRRVMASIWEDLGRGQATESLVDVAGDKFLAPAPSGPDFGRAIADLAIRQAASPSVASRLSAIEVAVAQLGVLVRQRGPADTSTGISVDYLAARSARPGDIDRVRDELVKGAYPPQAGRIAGLERRVSDVETLVVTMHSAFGSSGAGGGVSQIVAGAGLSGGTIISTGTIALGTIAAASLMGNAQTIAAVPGAIAIGANLTLSTAGTLSGSAPGTGTVTRVVAGGGLSGGTITSTGTLAADWNAGTASVLGNGITLDTGTLHPIETSRTVTADFTLAASDANSLIISNNATANVTLTVPTALGTGFATDLINLNTGSLVVVPGAGATLNFGASTIFPLPAFTSTRLVIDATGTNYSALPGLCFWQPQAGYVTALGAGLTLGSGTLAVGGTVVAASPQFSSTLQPTGGAANGSSTAWRGNIMSFKEAGTIYGLWFPLQTTVNAAVYQAAVAPLNASNVVQSVTNSPTIVNSGTAGALLHFDFSASPVVVSTGTTYALMCGRTDGLGTFVLPLEQTASGGFWRKSNIVVLVASRAATSISVGDTITTAAGSSGMGMDIL